MFSKKLFLVTLIIKIIIIIKENAIERIERTENILFSASVNVSFIIIEWYHIENGKFRYKNINS